MPYSSTVAALRFLAIVLALVLLGGFGGGGKSLALQSAQATVANLAAVADADAAAVEARFRKAWARADALPRAPR